MASTSTAPENEMEPVTALPFAEWVATGRDVEDLAEVLGDDVYEPGTPGRVYEGNLYIEKTSSGWTLLIMRDEWFTETEEPSKIQLDQLYDWYRSECCDIQPVESLARAFAERLVFGLGDDTLREIAIKERDHHIDGCCHSHDYCDANVIMAEAFKAVIGRETDDNDEGEMSQMDIDLWNEAWDLARKNLFWVELEKAA